ncbi:MAG: hypothetical protein LC795_10580 [Acidobacteria bacterium]|nr:hypothetical protein [Acidobacteriota bacterium]MCA1619735.1 hypothetical protein [Acidobacteriota bacterium]
MPAKKARRLVVDASVASAAGGKAATATAPKRCRDFLSTLRDETGCHVVIPPMLRDEWEEHMSGFTRVWLRNMTQRGRVIPRDVVPSTRMRREIVRAAATKKTEADALQKDFHLVEAAIAYDKTVVSLDDEVRRLFKAAARSVIAIKKVVWVNPVEPAEKSIEWLRDGARAEPVRMLSHE